MDKTLTAVFDGQVLRPDTPPDLEPNTRYVITVRKAKTPEAAADAWDVLEDHTGAVDAPGDWAAEHDHYPYGTPKRTDRSTS